MKSETTSHGADQAASPRPSAAAARRAPRRRRVVLRAQRAKATYPQAIAELEEQNSVGEALVRHLMERQWVGAVWSAIAVVAVFVLLPIAGVLFPGVEFAGIGLAWILLGPVPFVFLGGVGWLALKRAQDNERDFIHMVER